MGAFGDWSPPQRRPLPSWLERLKASQPAKAAQATIVSSAHASRPAAPIKPRRRAATPERHLAGDPPDADPPKPIKPAPVISLRERQIRRACDEYIAAVDSGDPAEEKRARKVMFDLIDGDKPAKDDPPPSSSPPPSKPKGDIEFDTPDGLPPMPKYGGSAADARFIDRAMGVRAPLADDQRGVPRGIIHRGNSLECGYLTPAEAAAHHRRLTQGAR